MMKVDWYCGTFSMDRTTLDQGEIYMHMRVYTCTQWLQCRARGLSVRMLSWLCILSDVPNHKTYIYVCSISNWLLYSSV